MNLKRAVLALRRRVFLPIGSVTEFKEPPEEIAKALHASDAFIALDILEQARGLFREASDRAEGAERRATTLLGAAAIAGSLTVGGGGLLLDRHGISGGWRIGLSLGYFATVAALICTALRAVRVLGVHRWTQPDDDTIFERANRDLAGGRVLIAAHLLHAVGRNRPIARWKVAQLRASAWWFMIAIAALLYTMAVVTSLIATRR
jgi:hypothetical protein